MTANGNCGTGIQTAAGETGLELLDNSYERSGSKVFSQQGDLQLILLFSF